MSILTRVYSSRGYLKSSFFKFDYCVGTSNETTFVSIDDTESPTPLNLKYGFLLFCRLFLNII